MAIGLVPSCPEAGLGTGRGPSGARMNSPGCPADDRPGAGQPGPSLEHVIQTRRYLTGTRH